MNRNRSPLSRRLRACAFLFANVAALGAAHAQCSTAWLPMGSGLFGAGGEVGDLLLLPNGHVVAGGVFSISGTTLVNNVALWNGSSWSALGTGVGSSGIGGVAALALLPNGDIVAGGTFTSVGGTTVNRIARWNGATWSSMGSGMVQTFPFPASVNALAVLPNGDLIAGGYFSTAGGVAARGIARWNGANWSAIGNSDGNVWCLEILPDGDLIAGGFFFTMGGVPANNIARWDGNSWSALGQGCNSIVRDVVVRPNGDIVAGGSFSEAGGSPAANIARWNGASWLPLGAGVGGGVYTLGNLPAGDLLVSGAFTTAGGVSAYQVARWDGAAWAPLGAGVNGGIGAMVTLPDEVLVGGGFSAVDGVPADYVVRMTTTCPAAAVAYGDGCSGSGGPNQLVATELPWIGSTFRARTTGLATDSLAIGVFGFSQISVPLGSGHPLGQPGCDVLVADEILIQFMVGNGEVQSYIDLPNAIWLVGGVFYHQVVPVELDALGDITALTSSNALTLTAGVF